MRVVAVCPTEAGWEVRTDAIDNAQLFVTAMNAETAAHRLARAIAHGGEDVSLQVHQRDGVLAQTRMVWAED